jgi:hypothetical protein
MQNFHKKMEILRGYFYNASYSIIIIFLFLYTTTSYSQLIISENNTIPIVGLDHIHSIDQKEQAPILFIQDYTSIHISASAIFFVSKSIQVDNKIVPTSIFYETFRSYSPTAALHSNALVDHKEDFIEKKSKKTPSDYHTPPFVPGKETPLNDKKSNIGVTTITFTYTHSVKVNNIKLLLKGIAYLQTFNHYRQLDGNTIYFTDDSNSFLDKNATEFSSRPPPTSALS